MSSDDGIYVRKCEDTDRYGIFRYCASVDEPPDCYNESNAVEAYDSPITAILCAHTIQFTYLTEYGVSIHKPTLRDARAAWEPFSVMT